MKKSRRRTLLAVLLAVFAISALASASASAARPEFRGIGEGKTLHPVSFTGNSGVVAVSFDSGSVQCTTSSISGEIVGPKEVAKVIVKFNGGTCDSLSFCRQSAHTAYWETRELKGRIAYLNKATGKVGLLLEPVTAPFAKCDAAVGSGIEQLAGSLIAEIGPVNVFGKSFNLHIEASGRKQQFTHFEGEELIHRLETIHHVGEKAGEAGFEFREDALTTASAVSIEA